MPPLHGALGLIAPLLLSAACGRVGYGALTDGGASPMDAAVDSATGDSGAVDSSNDSSIADGAVADSSVADSALVDAGLLDGAVGPTCVDENAGRSVGNSVATGNSSDADDSYPGCGSGREDYVAWNPPVSGRYSVVVRSSAFTPKLAVLADDCTGTELACDLTAYTGMTVSTSQVIDDFVADDPVVFVVSDALGDVGGDYTVDIGAVFCNAALDAGTSLASIMGTTVGGMGWFRGSCSVGPAPEATVRFEAPSRAYYEFNTAGSDFDTVLYVRDGDCDGAELACNDDVPGGGGTGMTTVTTSAVTVLLNAGQVVFIAVDGRGDESGAYVLNIIDWGLGA